MTRILTLIAAAAGAAFAAYTPGAQAKLPPPTEAQQAKAAETKARAAWSDKVAAYQLCRAQDKTAAHYYADRKAQGKEVREPAQTAPCADPGPFVAPTAAAPAPAVAGTAGDAKPPAAGAVQSPAKAP
ncbi:hypothetical protein [Cupriavidus lacunae]|uniref:Uncharacterized protein n=1 Tax=Cupriavidus lacunae TaxID=2666307 RepID=A0A370P2T0_9BURK|nr:hypothetical protein [Cupriavidus lacunae]RDK12160.1 hypothetical protein DN412_01025 [Cupriavidus lacunae]